MSNADFQELVQIELKRARDKYTNCPSPYHYHSIILKQVDEFWSWVKYDNHPRESKMLEELVQIATMCQRAAEDLGLLIENNMRFYRK